MTKNLHAYFSYMTLPFSIKSNLGEREPPPLSAQLNPYSIFDWGVSLGKIQPISNDDNFHAVFSYMTLPSAHLYVGLARLYVG